MNCVENAMKDIDRVPELMALVPEESRDLIATHLLGIIQGVLLVSAVQQKNN